MGIIKNFVLKNAAKISTKNLPQDQQQMIMTIVDKDPALFEKIAKETKALIDAGKPEFYAGYEIMQKYNKEIQALLSQDDIEKIKDVASKMTKDN